MSKRPCCGAYTHHRSWCPDRHKVDPEELSETVSDNPSIARAACFDCGAQSGVAWASGGICFDTRFRCFICSMQDDSIPDATPEPPKGRPEIVGIMFNSRMDGDDETYYQQDRQEICEYIESLEAKVELQ